MIFNLYVWPPPGLLRSPSGRLVRISIFKSRGGSKLLPHPLKGVQKVLYPPCSPRPKVKQMLPIGSGATPAGATHIN